MDIYTDRVKIVQAESTQLRQYLDTLPPGAWSQPSTWPQWQVQGVVAHLAGVVEFYADTIARELMGDTSPPEGFPPAGSVNAAAMAEPLAHSAVAMRERLGDQALATFVATTERLNRLLARVGEQE